MIRPLAREVASALGAEIQLRALHMGGADSDVPAASVAWSNGGPKKRRATDGDYPPPPRAAPPQLTDVDPQSNGGRDTGYKKR